MNQSGGGKPLLGTLPTGPLTPVPVAPGRSKHGWSVWDASAEWVYTHMWMYIGML